MSGAVVLLAELVAVGALYRSGRGASALARVARGLLRGGSGRPRHRAARPGRRPLADRAHGPAPGARLRGGAAARARLAGRARPAGHAGAAGAARGVGGPAGRRVRRARGAHGGQQLPAVYDAPPAIRCCTWPSTSPGSAAAVLFWRVVLGADPVPHRPGPIGRLLYLMLFSAPMGPSAPGLWSSAPWYAGHALADQREAGALMLVGGGVALAAITVAVAWAALRASTPAGRVRAGSGAVRRAAPARAAVALAVCCAALAAWSAAAGGRRSLPRRGPTPAALLARGRELYAQGVRLLPRRGPARRPGRGPALRGVGAAAADFYLSTGRMPLADPTDEPVAPSRDTRAPTSTRSSPTSARFGGPPLPRVDPARGDVATREATFTEHCAGCHQIVGRGRHRHRRGRARPRRRDADPGRRGGPRRPVPDAGVLGRASSISATLDSIARYVQSTRTPTTAAAGASATSGPIPEGMVAWLLAGAPCSLVARLIGERGAGHEPDAARVRRRAAPARRGPERRRRRPAARRGAALAELAVGLRSPSAASSRSPSSSPTPTPSCSARRSAWRLACLAAAAIARRHARRAARDRRRAPRPASHPSRRRRGVAGEPRGAADGHLAPAAARRRRGAAGAGARAARWCVPAHRARPGRSARARTSAPWRHGRAARRRATARRSRADDLAIGRFHHAPSPRAPTSASSARPWSWCASAGRRSTCRPTARGWAPDGHPGLLEDLHARRLRGRALPLAARPSARQAAGARLPLPLLDVRRRRRGEADLRPRRPAAAAAAAARSTAEGILVAAGPLLGSVGPVVVGVRKGWPRSSDPRRAARRRPPRRRPRRAPGDALRLPRPLVVPARRDRAVLRSWSSS